MECSTGASGAFTEAWRTNWGTLWGFPTRLGCDEGLPTCDSRPLMGDGYTDYPDTYLRFDDKEQAIRSRFFNGERTPAAEDSLGVRGVVLGPTGVPLAGVRISAWADPFWTLGETGQDGTFTISLPEEASGPGRAVCPCPGNRGMHLARVSQVRRVDFLARGGGSGGDCGGASLPVEVRLPGAVDDLCAAQKTVSGTVRGRDERPVEGLGIGGMGEYSLTGRDGKLRSPYRGGPESFGMLCRFTWNCVGVMSVTSVGAGSQSHAPTGSWKSAPATPTSRLKSGSRRARPNCAVGNRPYWEVPGLRGPGPGSLPAGCNSRPGSRSGRLPGSDAPPSLTASGRGIARSVCGDCDDAGFGVRALSGDRVGKTQERVFEVERKWGQAPLLRHEHPLLLPDPHRESPPTASSSPSHSSDRWGGKAGFEPSAPRVIPHVISKLWDHA